MRKQGNDNAPSPLPLSLPPRGLSREAAAAYIGVSPSKFDELVRTGRMPPPICVGARRLWDRHRVDQFFEALDIPSGEEEDNNKNPWDEVK